MIVPFSGYKRKTLSQTTLTLGNWKPHQTNKTCQPDNLPIKLKAKMHWPEHYFFFEKKKKEKRFDLNSEKWKIENLATKAYKLSLLPEYTRNLQFSISDRKNWVCNWAISPRIFIHLTSPGVYKYSRIFQMNSSLGRTNKMFYFCVFVFKTR